MPVDPRIQRRTPPNAAPEHVCMEEKYAARAQVATYVARSAWNMLSPGQRTTLWDQFSVEAQGVINRTIEAYLRVRECPATSIEPVDGGRLWRVSQHGYARTITTAALLVMAGMEEERTW
jgi:hypothetical protein